MLHKTFFCFYLLKFPNFWLDSFSQLLISGSLDSLDIDDLRRNTNYVGGYHSVSSLTLTCFTCLCRTCTDNAYVNKSSSTWSCNWKLTCSIICIPNWISCYLFIYLFSLFVTTGALCGWHVLGSSQKLFIGKSEEVSEVSL